MKFPGSSKSTVQRPAAMKVTIPPETVQIAVDADVIVTGSPELVVALGWYVLPTYAGDGILEVTLIVLRICPPVAFANVPQVQTNVDAPNPHEVALGAVVQVSVPDTE